MAHPVVVRSVVPLKDDRKAPKSANNSYSKGETQISRRQSSCAFDLAHDLLNQEFIGAFPRFLLADFSRGAVVF